MAIYYIEVNAICIILLLLLRFQQQNTDGTSAIQRVLRAIITSAVVLCLSDMIAGIYRGKLGPSARIIIESSNLIYFEMIAVISYLWLIYVYTRLTPNGVLSKRKCYLSAIPLLIFTVVAITNPITHFLFRIDANNLYSRGNGIYLHWVIIWSYFLIPTVKSFHSYLSAKSVLRKQEILPLLLFIIAPFIASIIQMLFYGVTTTQVGITLSIAMICLHTQSYQVLTDALTGINNRRALDFFMENQMQHNKESWYTLIMLDVDYFKQINDKYGHMMGDLVLKKIALAIKEACKNTTSKIHISRFGGDEFIILCIDFSDAEASLLIKAVTEEINRETVEKVIPCKITVSIGYAQGECTNEDDFKQLLNEADQSMYLKKQNRPTIEKQTKFSK